MTLVFGGLPLQQNLENPLLIEWMTLQNQFDAFETISLAIKLVAVLVAALLVFVGSKMLSGKLFNPDLLIDCL
jgi:hypothetical protein